MNVLNVNLVMYLLMIHLNVFQEYKIVNLIHQVQVKLLNLLVLNVMKHIT